MAAANAPQRPCLVVAACLGKTQMMKHVSVCGCSPASRYSQISNLIVYARYSTEVRSHPAIIVNCSSGKDKTAKKINFDTFVEAVTLISEKIGKSMDDVVTIIVSAKGPT